MSAMNEIDEYISKLKKEAGEKKIEVPKTPIFDYNYSPNEIYLRDEVKEILKVIFNFDHLGSINNQFMYGSRGSGKTLTLKYAKKYIEKNEFETPTMYINCRLMGTAFKILSHISGTRTFGKSIYDVLEDISKKYEKLILILDEIDLLPSKERSKDLLYILSRSEKTRFQLFLLSNNPGFFNDIDDPTKSTLQLNKNYFKDYNAVEINTILELRCKEGDINIDDGVTQKIAALTTNEGNSDVRVALKTLELLYVNNDYSEESIDLNFKQARKDIYRDVVQFLSDQNIIILMSVVKSKEKVIKKIYDTYKQLAMANRKYVRSLSYPSFLNNMKYLQGIGLVTFVAQKVTRGWSNRIDVNCKDNLIISVFQDKSLRELNYIDEERELNQYIDNDVS